MQATLSLCCAFAQGNALADDTQAAGTCDSGTHPFREPVIFFDARSRKDLKGPVFTRDDQNDHAFDVSCELRITVLL